MTQAHFKRTTYTHKNKRCIFKIIYVKIVRVDGMGNRLRKNLLWKVVDVVEQEA